MASLAITADISLELAVDRATDVFSHAVHTCQDTEQDADVSVMSATPNNTSLQADDDFTLAKLKYALKVCGRKEPPGDDRILDQALKNLPHEHIPLFLNESNEIWRTGNIPGCCKSSVILPQLKNVKQLFTS